MKWVQGRQKTGYLKKCLVNSKLLKFDMYILKYPEGSEIPEHVDSAIIPFHEHHRINIVLKNPKRGGHFCIDGFRQKGRFFKFRPDKEKHSVTKVLRGTRYVLSIGWSVHKKTFAELRKELNS